MASVKINRVRKLYGDTAVLHGIDFDIADGEFVVLVGPSGCGKSTLLRMIAGLEEISDGEIAIDGVVVNDLPPKKRDLAMVFQSYALYPHMTVGENMGFSLKIARLPKSEIARQVAQAAEILGLTAYLDRYPRHLSGGQRQRVAMGRAIVRNPKVFLFDEPLSNLDAKLRGQMRAEIKSLHQRLGATTIYVTHDQTEAMTMADRIVVLRDGYVEQVGSPLDIYRDPRNEFVAGFIGSPPMNFLDARIAASSDAVVVTGGDPIQLPAGLRAEPGRPVRIGIRPKHFSVGKGGPGRTHDFLVDLVEPTGDEVEMRGRLFGQPISVVTPAFSVMAGDVVPLAFDGQALHLFDADSGKRIATHAA